MALFELIDLLFTLFLASSIDWLTFPRVWSVFRMPHPVGIVDLIPAASFAFPQVSLAAPVAWSTTPYSQDPGFLRPRQHPGLHLANSLIDLSRNPTLIHGSSLKVMRCANECGDAMLSNSSLCSRGLRHHRENPLERNIPNRMKEMGELVRHRGRSVTLPVILLTDLGSMSRTHEKNSFSQYRAPTPSGLGMVDAY